MMPKVEHLVADTNALVNSISIQEFGEVIYAVPEVISEVRDSATRQRLRAIPFDINFREPLIESIQIVTNCSKVTGDYPSLSAVDIKLIALTLDLTREYWPELEIKTQLERPTVSTEVTCPQKKNAINEEIQEKPAEETEDQEPIPNELEGFESGSAESESEEASESGEDGDEEEEEEDDGGGWITPQNYKQKIYNLGEAPKEEPETSILVACATKDYAMQNVLLQMGLKVWSNGGIIKQLRTYILRCYACFATTSKMEKVFCPECGHKTLKKVSITYNKDGTHVIHLSSRVRLSGKGKRYSLPKPQGGKYSHNPILVEDQQVPHQRPSKMAMKKNNPLDPDYIAGDSPFKANDVYSRASHLGFNKGNRRQRRK